MKYLLILCIGLVTFTSCGSNPEETPEGSKDVTTEVGSSDETQPEPSQEEMQESSEKLMAKLVDVAELNLQLNGADKWKISEDAFTKLMKIKQQIYVISGNMENYEVSSYNEMGKEFLEFIKTIPALQDEKANVELEKVLSSTKLQCTFMLGSNLQESQIAVINLSLIFEEVPSFFESK